MFTVRSIKLARRIFHGPILLSVLAAVFVLGLSACSVTRQLHPYSIDIRQGNYVTQEMAARLTPGMTEEQVRFIMGTPLLVDPFHADRWDYVYLYAPQGRVSEQRRITLKFKDGKLSSVEGDVVAAIPAAAQSTARATP
ncbi:MAG: SmpA/OmlA [Rhodocyclales bacterium]|nr:SmpA/OmlA [Rhodocyclales bacterium]